MFVLVYARTYPTRSNGGILGVRVPAELSVAGGLVGGEGRTGLRLTTPCKVINFPGAVINYYERDRPPPVVLCADRTARNTRTYTRFAVIAIRVSRVPRVSNVKRSRLFSSPFATPGRVFVTQRRREYNAKSKSTAADELIVSYAAVSGAKTNCAVNDEKNGMIKTYIVRIVN